MISAAGNVVEKSCPKNKAQDRYKQMRQTEFKAGDDRAFSSVKSNYRSIVYLYFNNLNY